MIRQVTFAAKCVKVGDLKEARDGKIGGSMSGRRGMSAAGCLRMPDSVEKTLSGRRANFLVRYCASTRMKNGMAKDNARVSAPGVRGAPREGRHRLQDPVLKASSPSGLVPRRLWPPR